MNSRTVQQLDENSWHSGRRYWVSADPTIGDPTRIRSALAKKMLESADDSPRITVLTAYSAFDGLAAIDVGRQMAMKPESFEIPQARFPVAVAVGSSRWLQGIWFNDAVVQRLAFSGDTKERVRAAVKASFCPRVDGILLHEGMSDQEHSSAIWRT
jgi:hypothetical protein